MTATELLTPTLSEMVAITEVTDLPSADIQMMFQLVNIYLNEIILWAFCNGIYTGIVAIALWSVFSAKDTSRGLASHAMVAVILCLYGLDTLTVAFLWSLGGYVFIGNGWNFWTVFLALVTSTPPFMKTRWAVSIASGISTLLADASLIWRCWTVWGRRWVIVLIPIVCTLTGTGIVHSGFVPPNSALTEDAAIKIVENYHLIHDILDNAQDLVSYGSTAIWSILYISFTMATTIFCTLLIVYRIVTVSHGPGGMGIRLYRGVIEIIVESALIYCVALLVYVVLVARASPGETYADIIASSARGIAPTLIVGRVAAGHARPDESWNGSTASTSSLRFRRHSEDQSEGTIDESDVEGGSEDRR
ncbi:uncharacterized protein ARMOST_18299 [Armillaria ostoyae]|uniref:Integral membrane protein n=1 Tax=Armillaria ostoyae TaxID=47428 RepID=A0A284S1E3_ARMOS|nr:uncharacterized protein ARMOST_18299 [Armillaria ostoyae]